MKICWCHSRFGEGGGPITIFTWAKELRRLGCCIEFVGEGGGLAQKVREEGFQLHLVAGAHRPSPALAWRYAHTAYRMQADVLIGVGTLTGMEAAMAAFFLRKPLLLILNVSPRSTMWPRSPRWRFPRVAPAVVVNREYGELCINKYGWPPAAIHHIPQRIDLSTYLPAGPSQDGIGRICFLRRLDHYKAAAVLRVLEEMKGTLSRWPGCFVSIAGDGDARNELESLSRSINRKLCRPVLQCIGYVDSVADLLRTHAVIVGSERCVIEALAAGRTAFVISDAGGPWRVTSNLLDDLSQDNFIGQVLARQAIPKAGGDEILAASFQADSTEIARCRDWVIAKYDAKVGSQALLDLLVCLVGNQSRPERFLEYCGALLNMYSVLAKDDFSRRRLD